MSSVYDYSSNKLSTSGLLQILFLWEEKCAKMKANIKIRFGSFWYKIYVKATQKYRFQHHCSSVVDRTTSRRFVSCREMLLEHTKFWKHLKCCHLWDWYNWNTRIAGWNEVHSVAWKYTPLQYWDLELWSELITPRFKRGVYKKGETQILAIKGRPQIQR